MSLARVDVAPAVPRHRPSSLALTLVMVVTGALFTVFVVAHLIGNLKVYGGAASFDAYARWLREVGQPLLPREGLLWALRVTLAVALVGHVGAGVLLWLRGRRSRGPRRRRPTLAASSLAAHLMLPGGVAILGFLVLHLLDLTLGGPGASAGYRPPEPDGTVHAHANLVASFSRPWMATAYVLWMIVLAAHVWHGWHMMAQDLGMTGRRTRVVWATLGALLATALLLGNALIPVLVQVGVIA